MAKVYIGFADFAIDGVDSDFIHLVFGSVSDMANLPVESEVGLILTTDEKMSELNKEYRGIDKPTNVLSFSYLETSGDEKIPLEDKNYLGDIYICRSEVKNEAKKLGVSEQQEFVRLFVHGLLHLAGIHHGTLADAKKMEDLEDEIISHITQN